MDKSWIDWPDRCSRVYFAKLDEFLEFAFADKVLSSRIYCPCRKCENRTFSNYMGVREHLRDNGFWTKYKIWEKHGEVREQLEEPLHLDDLVQDDVMPDCVVPDDVGEGSDHYMDEDMVRLVHEALGAANGFGGDGENGGGGTEIVVCILA